MCIVVVVVVVDVVDVVVFAFVYTVYIKQAHWYHHPQPQRLYLQETQRYMHRNNQPSE